MISINHEIGTARIGKELAYDPQAAIEVLSALAFFTGGGFIDSFADKATASEAKTIAAFARRLADAIDRHG